MIRKPFLLAAAVCAAASIVVGCSSEEKLYDVSGTVTHNGKPIPKGLIFFDPDMSKGGVGTQGFANILNGKYDTADKGKGIRGGAYIVRVSGFDGKEANDAPFGQSLFPEYTETRELPSTTSTLDIDVKKGKGKG